MTSIKVNEQKKQDEQKREKEEKVKEDKKAKEFKPVDFVRKDLRSGIYSTSAIGRRVQIKDRQHFLAKTQAEVDFFNADPEIVVFDSGEKKK